MEEIKFGHGTNDILTRIRRVRARTIYKVKVGEDIAQTWTKKHNQI